MIFYVQKADARGRLSRGVLGQPPTPFRTILELRNASGDGRFVVSGQLRSRGLGEVLELEDTNRKTAIAPSRTSFSGAYHTQVTAPDEQLGDLGGKCKGNFFKKAKCHVSNAFHAVDEAVIQPVKDALADFDKLAIRPIARPIDEALKEIDKAVIRPVARPIDEALKDVERATLRPVGDVLAAFDRVALRPVYKPVAKGLEDTVRTLDQFVPGWAVLVDAIAPALPFLPAITHAIAAAAKLTPQATAQVFESVNGAARGVSAAVGGVQGADRGLAQVTGAVQNELALLVASAARAGVQSVATLAPVQATLAKAVHTFETTKGTLEQKLLAVSFEIAQGVALALSVAAEVATAGAATPEMLAALQALRVALTVVTEGTKLALAAQAARAIREAAKRQAARVREEIAAIDRETEALEREIRELRRRRAAIASSSGLASPEGGRAALAFVLGLLALEVLA